MKSESGVEAASRISGVFYLLMMTNSQWEKYLRREHNDFYHALLRQLIACRQQHIFVSEKGRYETPKEKYKVVVNDGSIDEFSELFEEAKKYGNEDMVYIFMSTSKVSFPGAGVAAMATSEKNVSYIKKRMLV